MSVGVVASLVYGLYVKVMLPETCMDRKPFRGLAACNPFTFVSLFNPRHEYNVQSKCAVMKMAAAQGICGCNWMPSLDQLQIYTKTHLNWSPNYLSYFFQMYGVGNLASNYFVGFFLRTFGKRGK